MDPDSAYTEMIAAHQAEEHEEAIDAALALGRWITAGGFPPADMTRAETRMIASLIALDSRTALATTTRRSRTR